MQHRLSAPAAEHQQDAGRAAWVALTLCGAFVLVLTVGLSVPTNHDEFQYIAAAHLYPKMQIYEDFFYSQTPYFPAVLSAWTELLEPVTGSAYLSGRLFNVLWSVIFVTSLAFVLIRISPSLVFSLTMLVLVISSSLLDLPLRVTRNDMMPLSLSTAALALIVASIRVGDWRAVCLLHFSAGFLISLAVGAKQSYAFVALAFAIYAATAFHMPFRKRLVSATLPIAFGGLVGAIPMLLLTIPSWRNFYYSSVEFHNHAHALWYGGGEEAFTLRRRISDLAETLIEPSVAIICVLGLIVLYAGWKAQWLHLYRSRSGVLSIFFLCTVTTLAVLGSCLLAKPLHPQYAAPLLPFLATGIVAFARLTQDQYGHRKNLGVLQSASVIALVLAVAGALLTSGGALTHVNSMFVGAAKSEEVHWHRAIGDDIWIADHLDRVRSRLHEVLGQPDERIRIATIMSAYPIDAGYGIYPEFAGAPFFYRVQDHLDGSTLDRLVGTSPSRVESLLSQRNAQALLIGYDPQIEEGFERYADMQGFVCFRVDLRGAYRTNEGKLLVSRSLTDMRGDC